MSTATQPKIELPLMHEGNFSEIRNKFDALMQDAAQVVLRDIDERIASGGSFSDSNALSPYSEFLVNHNACFPQLNGLYQGFNLAHLPELEGGLAELVLRAVRAHLSNSRRNPASKMGGLDSHYFVTNTGIYLVALMGQGGSAFVRKKVREVQMEAR